jgi:hypothetical protein
LVDEQDAGKMGNKSASASTAPARTVPTVTMTVRSTSSQSASCSQYLFELAQWLLSLGAGH